MSEFRLSSNTNVTSGNLSDEQLLEICEAVDVIACECPGYLVHLLREVKKFRRYTEQCVETFPEAVATHHWLAGEASQVETLLSQTIVELLHREGMLDEQGHIRFEQLSQRAQKIALSQIEEARQS